MNSFTFEAQASRIVFGAGCISQLDHETNRLGCSRALLISTAGRSSLVERAREILGPSVAGVFDRAAPHVPQEIAFSARECAQSVSADVLISLGGSSAIGVAKAIALSMPLPIIAVPTTYGGSEMTPIWGMTQEGKKETGRNFSVQPRVVIYDPDLTLTLSAATTAASGLNAVAHCIEALYAPDANPLTTAAASEGLRLLTSSLPLLATSPTHLEQRSNALRGAWLAGYSLGTVQMGLQHKLAHVIGGSFDLPHAETHAVLLPYTAAYNRSAMGLAARVLDVDDVPSTLLSLARSINAPASLRELGMREEDLDRAADLAVERQYPNPVPVTRDGISILLEAAYRGKQES